MIELNDLVESKSKVPQYLSVRIDDELYNLLERLREKYGKKNAAEVMRRSLRAGASEAIERKKVG